MYTKPDFNKATDRLAHVLSEMHNDNAPIGWERYRSLANMLMSKFPITDIVMDGRFLDHDFQPGKDAASKSMTWKIRVSGYGTFDFDGTEEEAEDMRRHKCQWEQGTGIKWRADLARESDRLGAEMAALFDAGKGCPTELFDRRRKVLKADGSC